MNTHDDYLRYLQAVPGEYLARCDEYADWLQQQGLTGHEEYVRLIVEQARNPARKSEMLHQQRRLRTLRETLGSAWCDLVERHTATTELAVAQSYGELVGRLDALTALSRTTADQLDYAIALWHRQSVHDELYLQYFSQIHETEELELIELANWEEAVRVRLADWLSVCVDFNTGRAARYETEIDEDILMTEFIRLFRVITQPVTVCRVHARVRLKQKAIPRSLVFEGPQQVLALSLTVVEETP